VENGLALLCGTDIPSELVFKPIARLAGLGSPLYVVDGDNSFRSYLIARYARAMSLDPRLALTQVQVSRAFTCYQLAAIVERLSRRVDTANCVGADCVSVNCAGIVCLGLLGTFYDEDVAWPEAQRLLQEVITCLKSLAKRRLVLVTVCPPSSRAHNRSGLIQSLMQQADFVQILPLDPPARLPTQVPLGLKAGK